MHLTLLPYIKVAGELKTKPTQHSVKELRSIGTHIGTKIEIDAVSDAKTVIGVAFMRANLPKLRYAQCLVIATNKHSCILCNTLGVIILYALRN
jgi:hypothetical protein